MAAPNIAALATITGKTVGVALTTGGGATILANSAGSGKVLKVNALYVANIDGANSADATVNFVDASPSLTTAILSTVAVPADSTLIAIDKNAPIYLEEGDSLVGIASASGDLVALVSYEEMS
jgi:hypothetical protein